MEEIIPIDIILEDGLAFDTADDDVVKCAWRVYTGLARHTNNFMGMPCAMSMYVFMDVPHYHLFWLVDGLQEDGYKMHLANPAAIKQYEGIKHTDDKSDAFWLAQMLMLGILPEGYIYPQAERPTRDLLRRRLLYVQQRTKHVLSLKSMVSRCLGETLSTNRIKQLKPEGANGLFKHPHQKMAGSHALATIRFLSSQVKSIEKEVMKHTKIKPEFASLLTAPGIGNILGMTIMLEVGDIRRFAKAGNYASYCRCVKSQRLTNDKKKGSGNRRCSGVLRGRSAPGGAPGECSGVAPNYQTVIIIKSTISTPIFSA